MLSVATVALLYFPHYLINGVFFWRKNFNKKNCAFIFSTDFSERLLIRRRLNWHIFINIDRSSCKLPVAIVRFPRNLNFLDRFSESLKYQVSREFVRYELSCSMRKEAWKDGQTDLTKLIVGFRNFTKAPKIALETFESLWISYNRRLYAQTHCLGVTWRLRREQKMIIFSVGLCFECRHAVLYGKSILKRELFVRAVFKKLGHMKVQINRNWPTVHHRNKSCTAGTLVHCYPYLYNTLTLPGGYLSSHYCCTN